jgi:Cell cycle protein
MIKRIPDVPLMLIAFALSIFGISMVYSAGQTDTLTFIANLWKTQATWFVIAVCAAFVASSASVRFLDWVTPYAYVITIVMLLLTLAFGGGAGTAASSKSWLVIGGVRIGQPAELAKLTVVLMLARVLANRREPPESLLELWHPALVVGIPWVLIMLQPDLGTGIVFIGIFFAMLFRRQLAAAAPDRESGHQSGPGVQHAAVGRVVPAAARSRLALPPLPAGRDRAGLHQRRDRGCGADPVGEAGAVSAEAAAGLPGPEHRCPGVRLPRHPVTGGHRLRRVVRQGVHARDAETAEFRTGAGDRLHLRGGG